MMEKNIYAIEQNTGLCMNKQREDMLWDTLDFQAKQLLNEEDYDVYLSEREISCREVMLKFIHDCVAIYNKEEI
jgi:hypothetical protein